LSVVIKNVTSERIEYSKARAKEGAGPVTIGAELSYSNTVITHAAAAHGINVSKEQVDLARGTGASRAHIHPNKKMVRHLEHVHRVMNRWLGDNVARF